MTLQELEKIMQNCSREPETLDAWAERMRKQIRNIPMFPPKPPEEPEIVFEPGSLGARLQAAQVARKESWARMVAEEEEEKKEQSSASETATSDRMGLGHLTSVYEGASPEELKNYRTAKNEILPATASLLEGLKSARLAAQTLSTTKEMAPPSLSECLKPCSNLTTKGTKHVPFKTKAGRADHLHTDDQKSRTKLAQQTGKKKRDEARKEKDARFEEKGGIIHPPTKYPPGTVRKKPNKNGVRISKDGLNAKRLCGLVAQEVRFWKGERFDDCQKQSAAFLLPGREFQTGFQVNAQPELARSPAEADVIHSIRSQLLPDVTIDNAETTYSGNKADDVSLTFSGVIVRCTRDLDLNIGQDKLQIQVKGTSLRNRLFWTLKAAPYSDKYSDLRYKHSLHNAKRKGHKTDEKRWLNSDLRLRCNSLFLEYVRPEIEDVRVMINVSATTAKLWKKESVTLKDSDRLIDVLGTEDENFINFYRGYIKAVFPVRLKINRRTEEIFSEKYNPEDYPDWTCVDIVEALRECQFQAKDECDYNDYHASHSSYHRWYWKLRLDDLKLPPKFEPTSIKISSAS